MATDVQQNVRGASATQPTFQPIGGGSTVALTGMDGLMKTNAALLATMKSLTDEIKVLNERSTTMGIPGAGNTADIADAIGAAVADYLGEGGEPGETPAGRRPSAASRGGVSKIGAHGVPTTPSASALKEYRDRANKYGNRATGFSMKGIRQDIGHAAEQRLANRTWGPQLEQDEQGRWIDPTTVDPTYQHAAAQGIILPWLAPPVASEQQVEQFKHRESSMMAMRGAATVLARGGTIGEAGGGALMGSTLGAAALKTAGSTVAVLHGIEAVAGFAESQRAENANWQRIMGGTNLGAFEERFKSNMFGLSTFGRMDAAEAERLYRGVAETGMRGEARERAQAFGVQNYMQMGMSTQQSLQILDVAARTGQDSLMGLNSALQRITDTAADASVNTERARESFIRTWTSFSETLGGQAGLTAAAGVQQAITGLGPEFQDVTASMETANLRMQAQQLHGMDLNQYLLAGRQPGQEQMFLQDWTTLLNQQIRRNITPEGWGQMQSLITQLQDPNLDKATRATLQRQLEDAVLSSGIDLEGAIGTLSTFGVDGLTLHTAPQFIASALTGEFDTAEGFEQAEAESRTTTLAGGADPTGRLNVGRDQEARTEQFREIEAKVRGSSTGFFSFSDNEVIESFLLDSLKTGRVGGISQMLAENADARMGATKWRVMTPQGEKEVSTAEVMSKYRDQLDAGTAVVVEGDEAKVGMTASEAFGVAGDPTLGAGQTAAGVEVNGSVTLGATPELSRLLRVQGTSGQVNIDPESGWAQSEPHVTPSARPTGNG